MPSLEMSMQNLKVRMEESTKVLMREKSEFVKTSVGDRAELNCGKGDQLFVTHKQGDIFCRK